MQRLNHLTNLRFTITCLYEIIYLLLDLLMHVLTYEIMKTSGDREGEDVAVVTFV